MTTEIKKPRAGFTLYQETLKQLQSKRESAQNSMGHYARSFADDQKPEDRANYLLAKARFEVWDEAICFLTKNAGDWMRLDFPKDM